MQIAYRSTLLLLALVVWSLPTSRMLGDLNYFLKTGIYNNEHLFHSPRWASLLVGIVLAAGVTLASSTSRAQLRSIAAVFAIGLIGAIATLLAVYCLIYADLTAAKLLGARDNMMIAMWLAFEVAMLAIMYLIATRLLSLRRESAFYVILAAFSSTGLAKAVLLAIAPRVPVPGLSQITCGGPC